MIPLILMPYYECFLVVVMIRMIQTSTWLFYLNSSNFTNLIGIEKEDEWALSKKGVKVKSNSEYAKEETTK